METCFVALKPLVVHGFHSNGTQLDEIHFMQYMTVSPAQITPRLT